MRTISKTEAFDTSLYYNDAPQPENLSYAMDVSQELFRGLQVAVLQEKENPSRFKTDVRASLLRRIHRQRVNLRVMYSDSTPLERNMILNWLVYMGVTMREQLGLEAENYITNLPDQQKMNDQLAKKSKRR